MTPEDSDADAHFVALLTEHQSVLRLYVASLLPGNPSAADVAQLANTTIWKKREDFVPGTNFKAWIFSIARYEVLSYRKREARDSKLVFSDALEEVIAEELPEQVDDMAIRQVALRHCMEKLKPTDRELIRHRYFHRTPLNSVSEEVGRSVNSLKVTLHRIRNRLHGCIQSKMDLGKGAKA